METTASHSYRGEELSREKSREIKDMQFLFWALNDEMAFERAVLEQGRNEKKTSG